MHEGRIARAAVREYGAGAVEYALLLGLIAVAILGTVAALGDGLDGSFRAIATVIGTPSTDAELPAPPLPGGGAPGQPGPPAGCPPGPGGGGPPGGGPPGCR